MQLTGFTAGADAQELRGHHGLVVPGEVEGPPPAAQHRPAVPRVGHEQLGAAQQRRQQGAATHLQRALLHRRVKVLVQVQERAVLQHALEASAAVQTLKPKN